MKFRCDRVGHPSASEPDILAVPPAAEKCPRDPFVGKPPFRGRPLFLGPPQTPPQLSPKFWEGCFGRQGRPRG